MSGLERAEGRGRAALAARVAALEALLGEARREHYVDSPEGLRDCPARYGGPCECGAAAWNARIDALLDPGGPCDAPPDPAAAHRLGEITSDSAPAPYTCACCGMPLGALADPQHRCRVCQAAGCQPLLGQVYCPREGYD